MSVDSTAIGPGDITLTRAASRRLAATLTGAATAFLSGIVVARRLGEDGKGVVSVLSFLASIAALVAGLGLAEAAIVMIRRRGESARTALSVSAVAVVTASLVAGGLFVAVAAWHYRDRLGPVGDGILVSVAIVPATAIARLAGAVAQVRGHEREASTALVIDGVGKLVAVTVAVGLGAGIAGAMGGLAIGAAGGASYLGIVLWRDLAGETSSAWRHYLRPALRVGLPVQLTVLLMVFAGRADLLMLASMSGDSAAGQYSVALTVGQLSTFAASALAASSMPTIASLGDDAVGAHVARLARIGAAAAVLSGALLAVVAHPLIPAAFGRGFDEAAAPAVALALGGVFGAVQLVLARAAIMRGRTRAQLRSYTATAVTMIVLDLLLIKGFGLMGAAFASIAGNAVGAGIIAAETRRATDDGWSARELVPHLADFAIVAATPTRLLRHRP